MKNRLKSLEKIQQLQAKLHDLSLWRLAEIGQRREALEEEQREMIEAIDREAMKNGALLAGATRRLRAVDKQIAGAKADYEAQSKHALDQGARAKTAQRLLASVDAKVRAQEERKSLADLIERTIRKGASSSA
jgi:hypothetical protein